MRIYVTPGALVRRISRDAATSALRQQLHEAWWVGDLLATSELTRLELTRFATRYGVNRTVVHDALAGIEFVPPSSAVLAMAAEIGGPSLDIVSAVHVASAKTIEAEVALGYDEPMTAAMAAEGIALRTP